ncbi:hypothetical protein [Streptomyces boninensis]|uniref:hypothetical protein n=1 Tax=Streptomyces boninensis TaxID=2039455 RepID=UPI003B21BF15
MALNANNRPLAVSTYAPLPPAAKTLLPSEEDLSQVVQDVLDAEAEAEDPAPA